MMILRSTSQENVGLILRYLWAFINLFVKTLSMISEEMICCISPQFLVLCDDRLSAESHRDNSPRSIRMALTVLSIQQFHLVRTNVSLLVLFNLDTMVEIDAVEILTVFLKRVIQICHYVRYPFIKISQDLSKRFRLH